MLHHTFSGAPSPSHFAPQSFSFPSAHAHGGGEGEADGGGGGGDGEVDGGGDGEVDGGGGDGGSYERSHVPRPLPLAARPVEVLKPPLQSAYSLQC